MKYTQTQKYIQTHANSMKTLASLDIPPQEASLPLFSRKAFIKRKKSAEENTGLPSHFRRPSLISIHTYRHANNEVT